MLKPSLRSRDRERGRKFTKTDKYETLCTHVIIVTASVQSGLVLGIGLDSYYYHWKQKFSPPSKKRDWFNIFIYSGFLKYGHNFFISRPLAQQGEILLVSLKCLESRSVKSVSEQPPGKSHKAPSVVILWDFLASWVM